MAKSWLCSAHCCKKALTAQKAREHYGKFITLRARVPGQRVVTFSSSPIRISTRDQRSHCYSNYILRTELSSEKWVQYTVLLSCCFQCDTKWSIASAVSPSKRLHSPMKCQPTMVRKCSLWKLDTLRVDFKEKICPNTFDILLSNCGVLIVCVTRTAAWGKVPRTRTPGRNTCGPFKGPLRCARQSS